MTAGKPTASLAYGKQAVPTDGWNDARPRERSDQGRFFSIQAKKPLHTGVRTGCHFLISLSVRPSVCVCQCMCNKCRFY